MPGRGFYVVPMLALGLGSGDLAAAKTRDVFVAAVALECFTRPSVCSHRQKQSFGIHTLRLRQTIEVWCLTAIVYSRSLHRLHFKLSPPHHKPHQSLSRYHLLLSRKFQRYRPSLSIPSLSAFPQRTRSCDVVRLGKDPFACGPISFEAETKPPGSRMRPRTLAVRRAIVERAVGKLVFVLFFVGAPPPGTRRESVT